MDMEVNDTKEEEDGYSNRLIAKKPGDGGPRTPGFVYTLTAVSAIGGFLFGYDTGVISGAMVILKDVFNLDTVWQELVVAMTIGAAAIFAAVGGLATEVLGRRHVITFASLVFTIGAICMGTANGKELLLAGRFIVGVGIGLASMSVPMYIAESAPVHIRGTLVTVNVAFITGGQLVASVIDGALSYDKEDGWRYMLGLAGIPSAIQFIGFLFLPESPRWLVSHGKYEQARAVLGRIRSTSTQEDVDAEFDAITSNVINNEREVATHSGSSSVWLEMIRTPALRRALVVGCGLQMFQQIAGINTVMYYSATIIEMSGVKDKSNAIWLAAGTAGVNFICTFIGLYLVERIGRRPLALLSLAGVVLSLIVLGVGFHLSALHSPHVSIHSSNNNSTCASYGSCYDCTRDTSCGFCYIDGDSVINSTCLNTDPNHHTHSKGGRCSQGSHDALTWSYNWCPSPYSWLPILGLVLYLFFFAPGMGPVPWTINSEIYPHWARSYGNSAATFTNWTFNLIVSLSFLSLTEAITIQGAFYLYSGLASLAFIFIFLLLPETKGLSLENVEGLFAEPWCGHGGRFSTLSLPRVRNILPNTSHDTNSGGPLELPGENSVQYVHVPGTVSSRIRGRRESDDE